LGKTVNGDMVKELVSESAANSLQLANAIRLGNIAQALETSNLKNIPKLLVVRASCPLIIQGRARYHWIIFFVEFS
jgi:hypothetical protein